MSYKHVVAIALLSAAAFAQTSVSVHHFVAPDYPLAAWLARVEGTAVADVYVKADGTVDSVKIISAHPMFRGALESALKQWTFSRPPAAPLRVTIRFQLDAGCPLTGSHELDKRYYARTQVSADLPSAVEVKTCLPITIESSKSRHP